MTHLTRSPDDYLRALREGSPERVLDESLRIDGLSRDSMPPEIVASMQRLARTLVEIRRSSVATLGSHEAFVRHTRDGSLKQVIRPVRLSLADKTLYQITTRRPYTRNPDGSAGALIYGQAPPGAVWLDAPVEPGRASLQFAAYVRMNAVAGCAVTSPRTVWVDGDERVNPYIERSPGRNGRLGDIMRIVVAVTVAGPAPATGNPVVVSYTLDYDPAKDLQGLLAGIGDKHPDEVYLVDEDDWEIHGPSERGRWKYLPLYGGVGWAHNLACTEVRKVYREFTGILANAAKKAWTVAQRNAMRTHPALGVQTVEIDDDGRAVIPVMGWAGDDRAMARWTTLLDALARGTSLDGADLDVEHVVVDAKYDPAEHHAPDVVVRATATDAVIAEDEPADKATALAMEELEQRGRLIQQIDDGLGLLPTSCVAELDYNPKATADELRAVLAKMHAMLERGA